MPWRPLPRIAFAIAICSFNPSAVSDLPLQLGDELYIIEEGGQDGDWLRGYLVAPPSLLAGLTSNKGETLEARVFSGIFPRECVEIREFLGEQLPFVQDSAEYINGQAVTSSGLLNGSRHVGRPPAPVPMLKIGDETPTSIHEPLVDEIASCLREWHSTNLHSVLLNRQYEQTKELSSLVERLDAARRQLLHNVLTQHEAVALRQQVVWDLVKGNKMMRGEVIVRSVEQKGRMLTSDDSPIELSRLQADMTLLDEKPRKAVDQRLPNHLLVSLASQVEANGKATSLAISIHKSNLESHLDQISEAFAIDASGKNALKAPQTRSALFTDLSLPDTQSNSVKSSVSYLVVRLFSNEPPKASERRSMASERPLSHDSDAQNSPNAPPSASPTVGRRSFIWPNSRRRSEPLNRTSQALTLSSQNVSNTPKSEIVATGEQKLLKRLIGVGVLQLTGLLENTHETTKELTLWTPDNSGQEISEMNDTSTAAVHKLLPSASKRYRRATIAPILSLQLRAFTHQDSQALIATMPTLLQDVLVTPMIEYAGTSNRPRSDIYVTLEKPSLPSDVMLSHPKTGSVPLPEEFAMRDLQITFEVRNARGERLDNCIFPTCNSSGHTAWRTIAIERGESWNQTVRLAIKPEDVPGSHIVASLADASNFPFALCWMPLWEHDAFVRDAVHNLTLYSYDEQTSSMISGRGAYLELPWNLKARKDDVFGSTPGSVSLRTHLCSSTFSQDPDVLALLMWHEQRSRDVVPILRRAQFISDVEIVKLLRRVLDAIFEIMTEYGGNEEVEDLTFDLLVMILGLVHDRRFNVQPIIDDYTKTSFKYPFAFPALTRSFTRLLSHALNNESAKRLRAAAKVGGMILRLIVLARQHQIQKEVGIGIRTHRATFARDLQGIFVSLNSLMQNTAPILVGTKVLLVQHFDSWLPQLHGVLTEEEIFSISSKFVDSCSQSAGKLVVYKLLLINHICAADYFTPGNVRIAWEEKTVQWIAPHWGMPYGHIEQWRDQIRLCSTIVSTMIANWSINLAPWIRKLVDSYTALQALPKAATELGTYTPLFPTTYPSSSKAVQHEPNYDEGLIEIAALLATNSRPTEYLPNLPESELFDLLIDLLGVYNSILDNQAFPSTWISLAIYQHKAILLNLHEISITLTNSFLPDPDNADEFATDLWSSFFDTLNKVVSSNVLTLETFPEQKRRAVWKIAGDVRQMGATLFGATWSALGWEPNDEDKELYGLDTLGGYQVQYVPSLVGPIVVLCLSVHEGLRRVATMILQTMIVSEWTLSQNLSAIQSEILHRLDVLFRSTPISDAVLQKLFIGELLQSFEVSTKDAALKKAIRSLVDVIDHLLDLLVVVYSSGVTGEASQIMDTLRLMDFLRDMQKEDIYIAYVHRLASIQSKAGNHAEAGLALRLHAELYDWNTRSSVAALDEPPLPVQKSFDRKEWIYFQMIAHFEAGSAWQHALGAYEELSLEYSTNSFDFSKLARARRATAVIYEKIAQGNKQSPRYFRVVYRGLGFPPSLRDKQFIFEGLPTDRTVTFADKLQKQFPLAQIVAGKEAISDVEGQYLSIIPVQAQKNLLHPVNRRTKVNNHVREHFMLAQPRQFTITPRARNTTTGTPGPGLHEPIIEKIVFTTAEVFPTILRRSEIIQTRTDILSPVQIALERTMRKTGELSAIELKAKEKNADRKAFKSLQEALNILARPDSGGSVAEYWSLVKNSKASDVERLELEAHQQLDESELHQSQLITALACALIDHALLLRKCLNLLPPNSAGAALTHSFESSFAPVLATLEMPQAVHPSQIQDPALPAPLSPAAPPSPVKTAAVPVPVNTVQATPVVPPLSPTGSVPFSSLDLVMDQAATPGLVAQRMDKDKDGETPGGLARWNSRLSAMTRFSGKGKDKGKNRMKMSMENVDDGVSAQGGDGAGTGMGTGTGSATMSGRASEDVPSRLEVPGVEAPDTGSAVNGSARPSGVGKRMSFLGLRSK